MPKISTLNSKLIKVIISQQIKTLKSDGLYVPTAPPTFCNGCTSMKSA